MYLRNKVEQAIFLTFNVIKTCCISINQNLKYFYAQKIKCEKHVILAIFLSQWNTTILSRSKFPTSLFDERKGELSTGCN